MSVPPLRGGPVLRWGVLAPGEIAGDFTATVHVNTDQRIVAVASRSVDRAIRFASTHGIERAMGSYEQLLSDPDIDVVYIAAPQSEHHALSLLAISAGKPVLIEKPIAMSAAQAGEIAQASRSAGVFAAEAMWTRYLPQFDVLQQVLERGDLGMIKLATADVGWRVERDTAPARFFDPAQGGGVSLDMGVYGYWFAQFAIGAPRLIRTLCTSTGGVEDQAVVIIAGPGDRQAAVSTSMAVTTSGLAAIYGTRGNARFLEPFVFPASFVISVGDSVHEWHDTSGLRMRAGLAWQATAVASFIAAGLLDSPLHSLDDAISIMRTIDTVRAPTEH